MLRLRWLGVILLAVGSLSAAGCSELSPGEGVACSGELHLATDSAQLTEALGVAAPGDCVLLDSGTFSGSFAIGEGVAVTARAGADAILTASGEADFVVALAGEGASLWHVEVIDAPRVGILVDGVVGEINDVTVRDAGLAGVGIRCQDSGCFRVGEPVELDGVAILGSASGLVISGARVNATGLDISESDTTSLRGGVGVILTDGADVELGDARVARNAFGIVVDGPSTRAVLANAVITDNQERGLWAQGLRGSALDPALRLLGASTEVAGNGLVGVGCVDSVGIRIEAGSFTATVALEVPISASESASIGDGIGLFGGTASVDVSGATLRNNARAQVLIDTAATGVVFAATNTVEPLAGLYAIVIQNTVAVVEAPVEQVTTGAPELALSAPVLDLPEL